MKTLQINLSDAQQTRLATLASMLNATPENLAVATIFSGLDGCDSWQKFVEGAHEEIMLYAKFGVASNVLATQRIEYLAPVGITRPDVYNNDRN